METEKQLEQLIKDSPNPELVRKAFEISKENYKNQKRLSGENYLNHSLRMAVALNEMKLGPETIAASLLHNTLDNKPDSQQKVELKEMEKRVGKEVSYLVGRVANLNKIPLSLSSKSLSVQKKETKLSKDGIENLKKMFFALSGDLRVVLIKLVSRLDNLNTLDCFPPEKQKLYAIETLKVFVPIANRLGIQKIKSQLEDLAFSYLYPERYRWLEENVKEKYEERERYLQSFSPHLRNVLEKEGVKVLAINYRAKSYWSTYQKLVQYNMDFGKVHDLVALRVIVKNVNDCYKAIGIIHKHYPPLVEEIDDFIAKPKPNGYRSLHTTVFSEKGEITEIQIRTEEMHQEAEFGICAHWAYKEKINLERAREKFDWVKELPKILKDFKIDFFKDRLFVFTPKGDVINLPKGSTPIDFAYAVHTDIGDHCEAAKVSGKMVSLPTPLENGDLVEIITSKRKSPSQGWLDFAKTNFARANIRKALRKGGSPIKKFFPSLKAIFPSLPKKKIPPPSEKVIKRLTLEVSLGGERGSFQVRIAKCCLPQPGDEIRAYITRERGASLHKTSCKNFQKLAEKFPNRVIMASWILDET